MAEYKTFFDVPYANASSPRHALDLYLPPHSNASSPLLVFIHGGAWRWEAKSDFVNTLAPALVRHTGLPVAFVDYRLTPEVVHPVHIQDVIAGFELLTGPLLPCEDGEAKWDRSRLVVAGHSAGAWMATTLVLRPPQGHESYRVPDKVRHAIERIIPVVGIYDLISTLDEYPDYGPEFIDEAFGTDRESYKLESPARWSRYDDEAANKLRILVIQSREDELVSPRQARVLVRRLRQIYGCTAEGEPHEEADAPVGEEEKKQLPKNVEVDFDSVGSTHMEMLQLDALPRRIGKYLKDL
ncbi:hypothetical protein JCM10908_001137 [Rhodotorula pacifica]|uniref:uncharacterized protein n=1 Tax=Rhodotorula pacifica TaxID=1495444 RepID=UPI00317D23B3